MAAVKEIVANGVCDTWQWEVQKVEKKEANQYGSHFFTFSVFQLKNIGYGIKPYGTSCPSWEGEAKLEATVAASAKATELEEAHAAAFKEDNCDEDGEEECPYTG